MHEIIATGRRYSSTIEYERIVAVYAAIGIKKIRMNCTRFSVEEYVDICSEYRKAFREHGIDVELQLDIPWPGTKHRMTFYNTSYYEIEKGNIYRISAEKIHSNIEALYIDKKEFIDSVVVGDVLLVGDGNLALQVIEKSCEQIYIKALNSWKIPFRKSIAKKGMVYSKREALNELTKWVDGVNRIRPSSVILSFCESADEICRFRELVREADNVEMIPKIETKLGVLNMSAMAEYVSTFLIGRGDLGLDAADEMVLLTEEAIRMAKVARKKVIVATGILDSLGSGSAIPLRPEMTDVFFLKRLMVDGFVASAPVSQSADAISRFVEIINDMEV